VRIGPLGPAWAGWFVGAAFWGGLGLLWLSNQRQSAEDVAWIYFAGAGVLALRGVYAFAKRNDPPPEVRGRYEDPDLAQFVIYAVIAATVAASVLLGFWLFGHLQEMRSIRPELG
jgi:hypothetical protein